MRKTFKLITIISALLLSANSLFALSLSYTNHIEYGNVQVQAVITKLPANTATLQSISYTSNATVGLGPAFIPIGTTYVVSSLTYTWNGHSVTFDTSELNYNGWTKYFPGTYMIVEMLNDGAGNYYFALHGVVGGG